MEWIESRKKPRGNVESGIICSNMHGDNQEKIQRTAHEKHTNERGRGLLWGFWEVSDCGQGTWVVHEFSTGKTKLSCNHKSCWSQNQKSMIGTISVFHNPLNECCRTVSMLAAQLEIIIWGSSSGEPHSHTLFLNVILRAYKPHGLSMGSKRDNPLYDSWRRSTIW